MDSADSIGYRRAGRALLGLALGGVLALGAAFGASAHGTFDGGGEVGKGGYGGATYAAGPQTVYYQDRTYAYTTTADGKGAYAAFDGRVWSDWSGWEAQPADFGWQPAAVEYDGSQYVFYTGKDGKLYQNRYDGQAWSGWQDLAGDYRFAYAPHADVYEGSLSLYAIDTTGAVYHKAYDGQAWGEWAAIHDDYAAADYEPYAVAWGGYENVFWTGRDGKVYWNRYDGTAWTGAKALAGDGSYGSAPYAIGYSPEQKLYAYAVSVDGAPYWNVFADGEGWTGWQAYKAATPGTVQYQPHAYEYDGVQHLVLTGTDGHAYHTTYDGQYGEWVDLGPNHAYDPSTFEHGDGYYLAYTGQDGRVYYEAYADGAADDGYGDGGY